MSTATTPSPGSAEPAADTAVAEMDQVDLVFSRRGAEPFQAITDLSFRIERGTVFCLLGPNGSGKTTAVNLLSGLLSPTRGTIRVLGMNPSRERSAILRRIALTPQETALYPDLTARENLQFHAAYYGVRKAEAPGRIDTMLDLVSLSERAGHRVGTFSGGMQRRLALARALLTEPDLLFLDEPTLGVDVQSREAIWNRIQQLAAEGRTVLLTTNYMEEAERLGQRVCIIDHGRRVVVGSPAELKAQAQRRRLELAFDTEESAEAARSQLGGGYRTETSGRDLLVEVPEEAADGGGTEQVAFSRAVLDRLDGSPGLSGFQFTEPSLQDVFLHFTGRDLRD
ncbi:ABC transporter ATP-binding protein [Streptomyces sp. TRM 70351]|uniref:ABC transporter ATP-binding protein n=1 Tax=Streptomyces sp. TRM 70351 TaxID=3116552 RepID=UPI002E7B7762|nr:ABC transporter ATP-binding protein [Streptomyces sp. TRM 70351]MEE1931072.1 ABC transporter ATP-binding protein [Streptomyces sp. TRM 70351]